MSNAERQRHHHQRKKAKLEQQQANTAADNFSNTATMALSTLAPLAPIAMTLSRTATVVAQKEEAEVTTIQPL